MNNLVNQGIDQTLRDGLLTSTSLLTNAPAADDACTRWRRLVDDYRSNSVRSMAARQSLNDPHIPFDLGIHLNLTQGRPLTGANYPAELLDAHGYFPGVGKLFLRLRRAKSSLLQRVYGELQSQIEWMVDRGLPPTHLNGHQYMELIPQITIKIPELLKRYSIRIVRVAREPNLSRNVLAEGRPGAWALGLVKRRFARSLVRSLHSTQVVFPDCFFGTSHAGLIRLSTLNRFLQHAPQTGYTEIGLHPSATPQSTIQSTSDPWFDPLIAQRAMETAWLCSDELKLLLQRQQFSLGRLQAMTVA